MNRKNNYQFIGNKSLNLALPLLILLEIDASGEIFGNMINEYTYSIDGFDTIPKTASLNIETAYGCASAEFDLFIKSHFELGDKLSNQFKLEIESKLSKSVSLESVK